MSLVSLSNGQQTPAMNYVHINSSTHCFLCCRHTGFVLTHIITGWHTSTHRDTPLSYFPVNTRQLSRKTAIVFTFWHAIHTHQMAKRPLTWPMCVLHLREFIPYLNISIYVISKLECIIVLIMNNNRTQNRKRENRIRYLNHISPAWHCLSMDLEQTFKNGLCISFFFHFCDTSGKILLQLLVFCSWNQHWRLNPLTVHWLACCTIYFFLI